MLALPHRIHVIYRKSIAEVAPENWSNAGEPNAVSIDTTGANQD